jgi:hypothetical protein
MIEKTANESHAEISVNTAKSMISKGVSFFILAALEGNCCRHCVRFCSVLGVRFGLLSSEQKDVVIDILVQVVCPKLLLLTFLFMCILDSKRKVRIEFPYLMIRQANYRLKLKTMK